MPPISGVLGADFSSFFTACQQAEVSLRGFEGSSAKVEQQLNRMVDSFSGQKVIADAQLMTEAVSRLGSPARLTRAELERVSASASQAVEKITRMGGVVPEKMRLLADAAGRTGGSFEGMGRSIRQVDNVLDVFGVNLGPGARALEDLEFAAGKTIGTLGALGTATVAAGAALGGWQLGRWIADLAQTDKIIGDLTAKMLGFGDVAAQTAGAQADAIARASKEAEKAGFVVLNYSTALAVNEAKAKEVTAANKALSDQLARMDTPAKLAVEFNKFNQELALLKSQGLLMSLATDINTHAFSVQQLAEAYKISTTAVSLFSKEAANIARIEANNVDKLATLRQQIATADKARREKEIQDEKDRLAALNAQIGANMKNAEAAKLARDAQLDAQIQARQEIEKTNLALEAQRWAALQAMNDIEVSQDYDLSTAAGMERFKRLNPNATISAPQQYFDTHSLADAIREGFVNLSGGNVTPFSATAGAAPSQEPVINVHVSGVFNAKDTTALKVAVGKGYERGAGLTRPRWWGRG
jgi:hypothetical protein